MYDLSCPYCHKSDSYWEYDGFVNCYVPYECKHCKRIFYILHRSFFDIFYDNLNVEKHKATWISRKLKANRIELFATNEVDNRHIYRPKWDIYKKVGGREYAERVISNLFNLDSRK